MSIKSLWIFAVFTGLCLFSATCFFAKEDWRRVQTKNFELIGNANENDIRRVATDLERFRQVFKNIFPNMEFQSPVPTRVMVFRDEKSLGLYKNSETAAACFQSDGDVNYLVLSVEDEKNNVYRAIFHHYTHFLLDNSFGRASVSPWFSEGLSEYMEQLEIGNNRELILGRGNSSYLQLLSKSKLIPLETLFEVDYYSLHRQQKENFQLFYAQSWLLMHYLIQGNGGARLNALSQFVEHLLQGKQPEFAFEKAFQTDYPTMEQELKNYLRQKSFSITRLTFDEMMSDNEISVSVIASAEAKALQGDLLYYLDRFDDAEKFLSEALSLDENLSSALTTFGLLRVKQKNFAEAKRFLEKAIQADAGNFRAYYGLALALSREQMTENGFASGFSAESAEKIRENLRQAIALNPSFAESYNLLVYVNVVRNEEIDGSFELIKKALAIAPGNSWYQMRLAELYLLSRNFNAARKIVQRLALSASDDTLKVYAENTLTRISSFESQILSLKSRKNIENEIVTEKPLSAEELARRKEKAILESLNRALRIPKADEKRVLGFILEVDCSPKGLIASVKTNERQLNLRIAHLEGLTLIAFDKDFVGAEIGCGELKKQGLAVVTYRPLPSAQTKVQGEITAIEFVPKNFRFLDGNK